MCGDGAFQRDPTIVGRHLTIGDGADAQPFEVIGVVGAEFLFPDGAEAWAPAARDIGEFTTRHAQGITDWSDLRVFLAVGRLAHQITPERAAAELTVIANRREKAAGNSGARMAVAATPLSRYIFGQAREGLYTMAGGVVVLLVACANAAVILLMHGVTRRRDLALDWRSGRRASTWSRNCCCSPHSWPSCHVRLGVRWPLRACGRWLPSLRQMFRASPPRRSILIRCYSRSRCVS